MDMQSLTLARDAMQVIVENVSKKSLDFTSYCAMVVQLPNRNNVRAVVVAQAGATASGINGRLVDTLDTRFSADGVPIIPCAAPTPGQGTWHMNDAEQQAVITVMNPEDTTFAGVAIKAVVANRPICDQCRFTLKQQGLTLGPAEKPVPLTANEAIAS